VLTFRLESHLQLESLIEDSDGVIANNFRVVSQWSRRKGKGFQIQTSETELQNNQKLMQQQQIL
jgi:hypothetical protein